METYTQENRQGERKIEVSKYAKEYVLHDPEVKALKWNGREIRNALQTAISLAGYKAVEAGVNAPDATIDVQEEHFKSVVRMSKSFKDYMDSIDGQDEGRRAKMNFNRNDAFTPVKK